MQDKDLVDLTINEIVTHTEVINNSSCISNDIEMTTNNSSTDNIIDSVREYLEADSTLNESIKLRLMELNETQLDTVFISLSEHFDTELTCRFGESFVTNNNIAYSKIVRCFIKHILAPKVR